MTMNTSTTATVVNTNVSTTGSVVTSTAVTAMSSGTTVVTTTSTPANVQPTSVPESGSGSVPESGNILCLINCSTLYHHNKLNILLIYKQSTIDCLKL